jgi:hypothetical protein
MLLETRQLRFWEGHGGLRGHNTYLCVGGAPEPGVLAFKHFGAGHQGSRGAGDLGGDTGAVIALGDREVVVVCRFISNRALVPRWRARRRAVSALIARRPFRIEVIRPEGTPGERPPPGHPDPRADRLLPGAGVRLVQHRSIGCRIHQVVVEGAVGALSRQLERTPEDRA